jgi:murein DD-endopeptidase MepM/ murein hydrolase activator NlpD
MTQLEMPAPGPENPIWDNEKSKLYYRLPLPFDEEIARNGDQLAFDIPENERRKVGPYIILPSPESHQGPFKQPLDFAVLDGTTVLAAQDGEVLAIVDQNTRFGPSSEFADSLNYVTLQHSNGEFSEYAHLGRDSVSSLGLKVGSAVEKGQQIGTVGKTGWTDRDHLHFLVFRLDAGTTNIPNPSGFKSLVPSFE